MAVYLSGSAMRPKTGPYRSPNKFNVKPGQVVAWTAATPIVDIAKAFDAHGVVVYVQGNEYHLQGGQDHTPWSKVLGKIFACDVMYADAAKMEKWITTLMKSDEDTTFIDYININNSQYNYAGLRLMSSPDHHLHISIKASAVDKHVARFVTLINAFFGEKPTPAPVKPVVPISKPVGTTPATQINSGGAKLLTLVGLKTSNEVFISDLITRRKIKDDAELKIIVAKLKKLGLDTSIEKVDSLDAYGVLVEPATEVKE